MLFRCGLWDPSSVRLAVISGRRRDPHRAVQFFPRQRPWSALRVEYKEVRALDPRPGLRGQGGPAGTQASVGPGSATGRRTRTPQPPAAESTLLGEPRQGLSFLGVSALYKGCCKKETGE